jgi:hypothetical protein
MSRKPNKTGRSNGEARHVRLYHWLLATAAWRSLDPVARAAYVDLAALYNGANNGSIAWSIREAAQALLVSPATAARALERLEERGFIVREKQGAFSRKNRHATEWRLTEFNCDLSGELATKDFARWQPGAQVHVVRPENSKHGARGETICARSETVGARGETCEAENGRLGTRGETSKGGNGGVSGARGETRIVYQGPSLSTAPAERERSAPPGSAVASSRVISFKKPSPSSAPPTGRPAA